MTNDLS